MSTGKTEAPNNNNNNINVVGSQGFCSTIRSELFHAMFNPKDPNGKMIDMDASFVMNEEVTPLMIALKFIFLWLTIFSFIYHWIVFDPSYFFPAFITNWTHFACGLYFITSFLLCVCSDKEDNKNDTRAKLIDNVFLKATWILFPLCITFQTEVVFLFWFVDYDPSIHELSFENFMSHGVVLLLVILDGFVLGRIPIRMTHYILIFICSLLYSAWLIIHGVFIQANPRREEDTDVLYDVVDFESSPEKSSIFILIIITLVTPAVFMVWWYLSMCCRKYVSLLPQEDEKEEGNENKEQSANNNDDTDEGDEETGRSNNEAEEEEEEAAAMEVVEL